MANTKSKTKSTSQKHPQSQRRPVPEGATLRWDRLSGDEQDVVLFIQTVGEACKNREIRNGLGWEAEEKAKGQGSSRVRNALRRLVAYKWVTHGWLSETQGDGIYRLTDAARKRLGRVAQKATQEKQAA